MAKTKEKETVSIKLFKSKDEKYSKPLKVFLNGKGYSVPRGVEVQVPKGVAEIIENSERQEISASEYIDSVSE